MNNLGYYRKLKGYTQVEFSKKLGVSRSYLAGVESGIRVLPYSFASKAAEILNVPVEDLIGTDSIRAKFRDNESLSKIAVSTLKETTNGFLESFLALIGAYSFYKLETNSRKLKNDINYCCYALLELFEYYSKYITIEDYKLLKEMVNSFLSAKYKELIEEEIKNELFSEKDSDKWTISLTIEN